MRSAAHTARRLTTVALGGLAATLVLCEASLAADPTGLPLGAQPTVTALPEPVATVVQEPADALVTGSVGDVAESIETGGLTAAASETTETVVTLATETTAPVRESASEESASETVGAPAAAGEVTTTLTQTAGSAKALAPVAETVVQTVESSTASVTGTVEAVASASSTAEVLAAVETAAYDGVESTESIVGLESGALTGVVDGVTEPLLGSAAALLGEPSDPLRGTASDTTGEVLALLGAGGSPVEASAGDSPSAGLVPGVTTPPHASAVVIHDAPAQVPARLHAKPGGSPTASAVPPVPESTTPVAPHLSTYPLRGTAAGTTAAGHAEPRRDAPLPSPSRDLPAAPTPSVGSGSTFSIIFAVLAGLALLATPRFGRRLLSSSALAPPMAFASPLERPG